MTDAPRERSPGDSRALSIFEKVIGLPKEQRDQEVERLCAGDERLLESVCGLLEHHADPAPFVDRPETSGADDTAAAIGPFRIVKQLGHGGMGVVYLAEQQEPVRREVALKLIKLGMDSEAIVARFEHERQSLAVMQHDGIAKVYDCGTNERGQPYFVMELVDGVPITVYCERHKLGLVERLKLMQQACAAMSHAHQKGVIHRDLKPGNLLVTGVGSNAQVKIIDFGLAKAMDDRDGDRTMFTEAGMVLGTPEYMAPEQADPENGDIDTRADIYSLGVVLYELLVDELPFRAKDLRAGGIAGLLRTLREVPVPRPSSRLSTAAEGGTPTTRTMSMSSASLRRVLRSDLDWVVLKALEKDRDRRYESADALRADLQRFLDHEPLLAGPPSAWYRASKFLRRYRGQVVATALVLLASVIGLVTSLNYAFEAAANADAEQQAKQGLADKVVEYDQLSGVKLLADAVAGEASLVPAWPHRLPELQQWLDDDAGSLLAMRADLAVTIRKLEARAPQATEDERRADARSHPRFEQLRLLRRRVEYLDHVHALRTGEKDLVVPEVPPEFLQWGTVTSMSWVADRVHQQMEERAVFGEEPLALAIALAATKNAKKKHRIRLGYSWLCWAWFANGQFDKALAAVEKELEHTNAKNRKASESNRALLQQAIDEFDETRKAERETLAVLEEAVNRQRTFRLESPAQQFLHEALAELLQALDRFQEVQVARVTQRRDWASRIADLTLAHPNARHSWASVREALATADDVVASKLYSGASYPLPDEQITGLVPIGMNPQTKLWEFYHLRSAWDGEADPLAMPIPKHLDDGSLERNGADGIVFVLIPGGETLVGSQKRNPSLPGYNKISQANTFPVLGVTLEPYFLARHEMTQDQFYFLSSGADAERIPSQFKRELSYGKIFISGSHPVEKVDWLRANRLLTEHGLILPTEAQWECACRAGTSGPWFCSFEQLVKYANLADQTGKRAGAKWIFESWDDGHLLHAPVGSFLPNAFGLYDMHGNVAEWCRDPFGAYRHPLRSGDGMRVHNDQTGLYPARGGAYGNRSDECGTSSRQSLSADGSSQMIGFRPARALNPVMREAR